MYTIVKVILYCLLTAGIPALSLAQQVDSLNDKIHTEFPDSTEIKDSSGISAVNKDSVAILDSLSLMTKRFDQFKYADVISIANKLLLKRAPLTREQILDIYKLKGISHYSLSEDDAAKKSFIEILRMDTSYVLDSTKVSPKIISFFKQVKQNYIQQQKEIEARTVVRIDTVYVPRVEYDIEHEDVIKGAIARSLIIPGLGQLYLDFNFKSVVMTVLGSASLASSIYYLINTEHKENAYLIETNPEMISSRYHEFNDSYKKRNISLVTFGVIWIYSQLDLLFFSNNQGGKPILQNSSVGYNVLRGFTFNLKYSF